MTPTKIPMFPRERALAQCRAPEGGPKSVYAGCGLVLHPAKLSSLSSEGIGVRPSTRHPLDDLLGDSVFQSTVAVIAREVYQVWKISDDVAHCIVLSAIGEPDTLACVQAAFRPKQNLGLAKMIMRRRVIDLLRRDARPANHCSLPDSGADAAEIGARPAAFQDRVDWSPSIQLELRQVNTMVRTALDCFAHQGQKQREQAQLLTRYVLDEVDYSTLSVELTCTKSALRVRVHKAMIALRKHVQTCHPELEQLLESRALTTDGGIDLDSEGYHTMPAANAS